MIWTQNRSLTGIHGIFSPVSLAKKPCIPGTPLSCLTPTPLPVQVVHCTSLVFCLTNWQRWFLPNFLTLLWGSFAALLISVQESKFHFCLALLSSWRCHFDSSSYLTSFFILKSKERSPHKQGKSRNTTKSHPARRETELANTKVNRAISWPKAEVVGLRFRAVTQATLNISEHLFLIAPPRVSV